jgi:hypothetical protein
LETLSTDDLIRLARRFGLDLPDDLNRVFMVEELLDASLDDQIQAEDDSLFDEAHPEPAGGLPSHYNETFIGVLLRDPVWAYAFWEIRQADREAHEARSDFGGYSLRISFSASSKDASNGDSFTIQVSPSDDAWYLCLPGGTGWHRVELLCLHGDREERLAVSVPFKVPRGSPCPSDVRSNGKLPEIFALSGIDELKVLQGGDRESRLPQHCDA